MVRVTRAASSGMKPGRNLDLSKRSSRPSNDDKDDILAKQTSRRHNSHNRDRPSKEKTIDWATRAVRKVSIGDEDKKKRKKKRRSHDDILVPSDSDDDDTDQQQPGKKQSHPIRGNLSDSMMNPRGLKYKMKQSGLYPSKSTMEERRREERISGNINRCYAHRRRRRGTHTGSFLRHEDSLLGGRRQ